MKISPRFIPNLIKKDLLPRFPGFAGPYEHSLFVVPMNHLWRGFGFQKSSSVPMWYVSYNVLPLYRSVAASCPEQIARTEMLLKLLQENPMGTKAQLEEWERQTIQTLKLQKFPN